MSRPVRLRRLNYIPGLHYPEENSSGDSYRLPFPTDIVQLSNKQDSIVTGNTSAGFLTIRASARLESVVRPDDDILRESEYFFQLPNDPVLERPYPVVARFED